MLEHPFTCPYCWQLISMLLDLSTPTQTYIEDCEVCCNPIQIELRASEDTLQEFSAEPIGQ